MGFIIMVIIAATGALILTCWVLIMFRDALKTLKKEGQFVKLEKVQYRHYLRLMQYVKSDASYQLNDFDTNKITLFDGMEDWKRSILESDPDYQKLLRVWCDSRIKMFESYPEMAKENAGTIIELKNLAPKEFHDRILTLLCL